MFLGLILAFLAIMMKNNLVLDVVLMICISIDVGLLFAPVSMLKMLRKMFEKIYLIFCADIKMKSQQILCGDIKNNKIMLCSVMMLFVSFFILNIQQNQYIQDILQIQLNYRMEYTIVVSSIGMLAYIVYFYNYVLKLRTSETSPILGVT